MKSNKFPQPVKKPAALGSGDTVAVIAPGSPISPERLKAGVEELRRLGYRVRCRDDITSADTFFAGSHARRYQELREALEDPAVKAVLCARGGYGCNYLVERLAADGPPQQAKILIGYSDVTSILAWLTQFAGWTSFHGPMVTLEFAEGAGGYDAASFQQAVSCTAGAWKTGDGGARTLHPGAAEGLLFGGCLPMLVATLGTPREIQTEGTLLFLEDVGAKPYQVDRMLFHLREAGKLDGVRGIILGEMLDCVQHAEQGYTLEEAVLRALDGIKVPVIFGFRSGHTSGAGITLPLGVRARLDAQGEQLSLEILEPAVI
jgi:muramoyltetrapeptide carboxypeptidase